MIANLLLPLGGIETALLTLSAELKSQGHEVIVYIVQPIEYPNQNAVALELAGIEILSPAGWHVWLARTALKYRMPLLRVMRALAFPMLLPCAAIDALVRGRSLQRSLAGAAGRWNGWLTRGLDFEMLYYARLDRLFQVRPPDVVHVHGWGCGEDPPAALKWLSRLRYPTVFTEHNSPDPELQAELADAPMNLADVLIAVSQAGRAGLCKVGRASRPVAVIPYSVDPLPGPSLKVQQGNEITITCVARLAHQKGHEHLLAAMPLVLLQLPNARLLLAGEGPLRQSLEDQVHALNLDRHVQFLGVVNRSELSDLLAKTDIVVLSSHWEGLPIALIEAMSAGKAIVATQVGGNPELVLHGRNGLTVPPADPNALAAALVSVAQDGHLRQSMGVASRQLYEEGGFSRSEVARKTLAAYCRAIELAAADQ